MDRSSFSKVVWPLAAALTLLPWAGAASALLGGVFLAVVLGNPYQPLCKKWTSRLLPWSVIGLGAGMDLRVVLQAGLHGLGYTVVSIALTLALGIWLARRLGVPGNTGLLVSVGTAICGGSAIAAVAPVISAEEHETSVALGTVFLLNAVALVLFPFLGHLFHLPQEGFGLWSALAIHDTSSVVGAGLAYGPKALQIAVTVKLARALWIVPVAFGIGLTRTREAGQAKGKRPWFILGFLIAAALATYVPALHVPAHWVARCAKQGLVLTLFLIGAGLTPETLRRVGVRPFLHGLLLWVIIGSLSLGAVLAGILKQNDPKVINLAAAVDKPEDPTQGGAMRSWVFGVCLLAACSVQAQTVLRIGGGTAIPAIFEPIRPHLERDRGLRLELSDKGPDAAFLDLQAGRLDAAVAGTSMDGWLEVMRAAGHKVGTAKDYKHYQLGEDRLSVLVNPDVVTDLEVLAMDFTREKIQGLFTGKFKNWKEVGGPDLPVVVVLGRKTAGANKEFREKVLGGAGFAPGAMEVGSVADIIEALIRTKGAIGIGPLAVTTNTKIWSPVQAPQIVRPFTLLVRDDLSPAMKKEVAGMVEYILGPGKKYLAH